MKLSELFLTDEDQVKKAEGKLKGLKRSIEDGDAPKIYNSSYTTKGLSWGDLQKLGFAEKDYISHGSSSDPDPHIEAEWTYTGPKTITLLTRYFDSSTGNTGFREREMKAGDTA